MNEGPFAETKFLGATVKSFTQKADWNEQGTSITISLVENDGDSFRPPQVGTPVDFTIGPFSYRGLLQHHSKNTTPNGIVFEVILTDPHELLDGCKVICGSITTPLPLPNLVNAFGYWENILGFGGAMTNSSGMIWQAPYSTIGLSPDGGGFVIHEAANIGIKPAIERMMAGGSDFGGPISFRGHHYTVDFTGLPTTPVYYRISGPSPSILEIVSQICGDAGCEYITYLDGNVIKFKIVSRVAQPSLGTIASYIAHANDAIEQQVGVELRNEPTNAVMIGGAVRQLATIINTDGGTSIWPYWGLDYDGNVIMGTGTPEVSHEVNLNAEEIAGTIGSLTYHVTIPELRCALEDYESWAAFVLKWYPDKAATIGIANSIDCTNPLEELFPDGLFRRDLITERDKDLYEFGRMNESDYWTEKARRVYNFVSNVASENFGSKFLVKLPFFLYWKIDQEHMNEVISSDEICDGGYQPEGAAPIGLDYWNVNKFMTSAGLFTCFVEFPYKEDMDIEHLPPDSFVISNNRLFMKAEVDSKIVYPPGTLYPCAVITLASPVYKRRPDPLGGLEEVAGILGLSKEIIMTAVTTRHGSFPVSIHPAPYRPESVVVPLKSNRLTYGPWGTFGQWGATGVPGKTDVVQDESLTPWECGDYDTMNLEAAAKLSGMATNMQISETGTINQTGLPTIQVGDALVAGGPNVTSIECSIGSDGVTTRYSMRTFTPKFGAFQKSNADRLRRLGLQAQQARTKLRALFDKQRANNVTATYARVGAITGIDLPHPVQQKTPHDTILSTMTYTATHGYRTQVSTVTVDEFMANMRADNDPIWFATGGMSLEGLYRPFSTGVTFEKAGDMPHFETPTTGVPSVAFTPLSINPIKDSDIDIMISGSKFSDSNHIHRLKGDIDSTAIRGIGFRGPMIIVGWGKEYTGKPLPNSVSEASPIHEWDSTYCDMPGKHPEKWRAGPLAVHWDNWRKVWTVPTLLKCVLDADLAENDVAFATIKIGSTSLDDKVTLYHDHLGGGTILSGTRVWAMYYPLENHWHVLQASCPA